MLEPACILVHTDVMLIGLGIGFRGIFGSRIGLVRITDMTRCSDYIYTSKLNKAGLLTKPLGEVLTPTACLAVSGAQF